MNGVLRVVLLLIARESLCATLEDIAEREGTDKARDEHGYVGAYAMLFDGMRERVRNVTEIGIHFVRARARSPLSGPCPSPGRASSEFPCDLHGFAQGKSIRVWHAYFSNAHIYGIDVSVQWQAKQAERDLGARVHVLPSADSTDPRVIDRLRLLHGSMDIVIDDGDHRPASNGRTLVNFWPLVKPGGYYIVEDVTTGGNVEGHFMNRKRWPLDRSGYAWLAHNVTDWPEGVREIYEGHDVFLADTLVGQREWDGYRQRHEGAWLNDRVDHNSHMLVIRKRRNGPRKTPVKRRPIRAWPK